MPLAEHSFPFLFCSSQGAYVISLDIFGELVSFAFYEDLIIFTYLKINVYIFSM